MAKVKEILLEATHPHGEEGNIPTIYTDTNRHPHLQIFVFGHGTLPHFFHHSRPRPPSILTLSSNLSPIFDRLLRTFTHLYKRCPSE